MSVHANLQQTPDGATVRRSASHTYKRQSMTMTRVGGGGGGVVNTSLNRQGQEQHRAVSAAAL